MVSFFSFLNQLWAFPLFGVGKSLRYRLNFYESLFFLTLKPGGNVDFFLQSTESK